METELKPCPFCGGEAKIQEYNGGFAAVGCSNGRCYMHPHAFGFPSAEDAAERWNRRAERTCRDTDNMQDAIKCSECGETTLNTLYWCDVDDECMTVKGHRPRFCSNCGARLEGVGR